MAEAQTHVDLYYSLLNEFSQVGNYPQKRPYLAHYAPIETILAILRSNQVLMGNPSLMNDRDEMQFILDEASKLLISDQRLLPALSTQLRYNTFLNSFVGYLSHFNNDAYMNLYMFCCSEHSPNEIDGILSMWRGYGGNGKGAAIVFNTANIDSSVPSPFVITKIEYVSKEERRDWIKAKINHLLEYIVKNPIIDTNIHLIAFWTFQAFKFYACTTKHPGFKEENEWRVVYREELDKPDLKYKRFYALHTSRGLEPRCPLKFDEIKNAADQVITPDQLIDKIILGPSSAGPFAIETFKRMLDTTPYHVLKNRVFGSTIPYRAV